MSDDPSAPASRDNGDAALDESVLRERVAAGRAEAESAAADVPTAGDLLARVDTALHRAEQIEEIGVAVPPYGSLGTLRRAVAYATGRFLLYLLRLITVDQRHFNRLLRGAVADLGAATTHLRTDLENLRTEVESDERLDAQQAHLDAVERSVGEWGWHIGEIAGTLAERDGRVVALEQRLADQHRALDEALAERDGRVVALEQRLADQHRALDEAREATAYLRRRLAERDGRIDMLLNEAGIAHRAGTAGTVDVASAAGPIVPAAIGADATGAIDDEGFQETFRGDEASLRAWLQRYVVKFADCADVLDVGCGRGEFLELLRDAGVTARGIDLSAASVLRCREKGLDVIQADALAYLAGLPDETLGGIFCAQVIEHLPAATAVRLIQLAYAKLRPGGVLLIETLNPECLLVHYRWFWMDLSHVRLLHPETLKFLFLSAGFHSLEGLFQPAREAVPLLPPLALASETPAQRDAFNAATQHLNALLHGGPDYALIGRR